MRKHTLARPVTFSGVGVHSGRPVNLTVGPSSAGRIVFRREDLGGTEVPLDPAAAEARHSTCVTSGGASVRTIEHLLSALRMAGLDSALVTLDAEEVPILDGSAAPFVRAFSATGASPLDEPRTSIRVLEPFRFAENDASVAFAPGPGFRVSYAIEFAHPLIGREEIDLVLTPELFASDVAPARTFGFLKDAEELRRLGLARGSSYENTVVLNEERVVNPPLRFPDEFVRHKVLDLVGDLAVAGAPLLGSVRAEKAGHALHIRALQALLRSPDHWTRQS